MTDSSEEEVEELFSEQPIWQDPTLIYLKPQPRTESFDKFVLDEVMIARAMISQLNSLNEKQRQRAARLKEGIAAKSSGVNVKNRNSGNNGRAVRLKEGIASGADNIKPDRNSGNNDNNSLEGWGPEVRSIIPPLTDGKVADKWRAHKEGAVKRDQAVKVNTLNKEIQVDFDLEGWSVPPITSAISPFGMANRPNPFSGTIKPQRGKKLPRVSDSGRKQGRASSPQTLALGNHFPLSPVNATDKAHAISSKPIEESVFRSVVAKRRQGMLSIGDRLAIKRSSALEGKEKALEAKEDLQCDKMLQSGEVLSTDDFSLTSIEAIAVDKSGTPSGSGESIEEESRGAETVALKSGEHVPVKSESTKLHRPQLHKKTELPPLHNSPLRQNLFKKKYPIVTKTLTSDGLAAKRHLAEGADGFTKRHRTTAGEASKQQQQLSTCDCPTTDGPLKLSTCPTTDGGTTDGLSKWQHQRTWPTTDGPLKLSTCPTTDGGPSKRKQQSTWSTTDGPLKLSTCPTTDGGPSKQQQQSTWSTTDGLSKWQQQSTWPTTDEPSMRQQLSTCPTTEWQLGTCPTTDGLSKRHWFTPGADQKSSVPYLLATGSFSHPSEMGAMGEHRSRLSWKTILEDASKLDGYKQMYANKKKRQEMEPEVKKSQEVGYLQRHLKTLSYGKLAVPDDSRRHAVDTMKSVDHTQTVPRPIEMILEKEVHNQFPLVHYDKSTSLSSLSEWTAGVAQQTLAPLQYSQLQLNLPEQESRGTSNKLASHFRKDALLEEQKNYYRLNSGAWQ